MPLMVQKTRFYAGWEPPRPESAGKRRAIAAIRWLGIACGVAFLTVPTWLLLWFAWGAGVCTLDITNYSDQRIDRLVVWLAAEGDNRVFDRIELHSLPPGYSERVYLWREDADATIEAEGYLSDGAYSEDGGIYVTGGMLFVTVEITIGPDGEMRMVMKN